jgi:hypothetical protein
MRTSLYWPATRSILPWITGGVHAAPTLHVRCMTFAPRRRGVDVASIDYGRSKDFKVHRITTAGNVPGLENLTRLEELPARGATVIALPMKIEGGSSGPVRVIALVPPVQNDRPRVPWLSHSSHPPSAIALTDSRCCSAG